MKWMKLLVLLLVPALAFADEPTGPKVDETVTVSAPEAALPPGPSDSPKKPNMQLSIAPFNLNSQDFVFPSGLRIIMQEDHSAPLVGITTWVDSGSGKDQVGKEGIAHFIEHLWFKSKHGEGIPKTWDLLDEMGCYLNAQTSYDYTAFMTVCSSEFLPVMLKLESVRMNHTVDGVTKDEMLTEREVVRNELRMRFEVGGGEMFRYLMRDVYPDGHPYHRETIGSHGSLDEITLGDIRDYVKHNYGPQYTTIVVVGDFDLQDASSLIFENFDPENLDEDLTDKDYFEYPKPGVENPRKDHPEDWLMGAWKPGAEGKEYLPVKGDPIDRVSQKAKPPPAPTEQVNIHTAPLERRTVAVSWALPGAYHGDDALYGLLSQMLSGQEMRYFNGSMSPDPRLYVDYRGRPSISCFYQPDTINSTMSCIAELSGDKVDGDKLGWDIVDQVAGIYTQNDPTQLQVENRYFNNARMAYMRQVLLSSDVVASLSGRAFDEAQWAHYTGSPTYYADTFHALAQGKVQDVQKAASEYLTRNQAVITVMNPIPKKDLVLDSSEQAWNGATRKDDFVKKTAVNLAEVDPNYVKFETHVPDLSRIKQVVLANGMRVVVMPHGEAPIAKARLIFGGGTDGDTDGKFTFMRTFSTDDLDEGSNPELDPLQFAGEFDESSTGTEQLLTMKASSDNLDSALWLLRQGLDTERPDTAGKSSWVKRGRDGIIGTWAHAEHPDWFVHYVVGQHWNPGHPITQVLMPDDYDRMSSYGAGDVKTMIDRVYQPANATLLIVGNVDPDKAIATAKTYFAGWRAAPGTEVGTYGDVPPPNPSKPKQILLFDNPGKTQTDVTFRCQVGPIDSKNEVALQVAAKVLDQDAFKILREQLGTTYGAGAYYRDWPGGSAELMMDSQVQNSAAATAVSTFFDIAKLGETGDVKEDQLKIEKLHLARQYGLGEQSVDQMTSRLTSALEKGLDGLQDYPDRLAAVDQAAIAKVLEGCSARAIVTVVGPQQVVEPLLKKQGIDYEVYDWRKKADEMLQKYDPKAYKKKMKAEAKKKANSDDDEKTAEDGDGGSSTAQ